MAQESTTHDSGRGSPRVPNLLVTTADWSWRLILVGALIYLLMQIIDRLSVVAIPCALAVLLCALLHPLVDRLRRIGMPSLAATWVAILLALGVLVGIGVIVGLRANSEFPQLIDELKKTAGHVQDWLMNGPLHLKKSQLQQEVNKGLKYIQDRQSQLANTALSATTAVVEFLAGMVLMLFVTFFLLKDGKQIWAWLISGTGQYKTRIERAGHAGWATLSHYVQGTVIVSAVHAVAVAITLTVMGVPLVAPLAVLVFFASFIPLVGILFAGGVALLVVLSAKGLIMGLIFLGILVVEQQLEGHLLQPLVVGRRLHFHPLGIIVVLSVGGVVGGIPGAALAVPLTAIVYRAWPELRAPDPTTSEDTRLPPAPPAEDALGESAEDAEPEGTAAAIDTPPSRPTAASETGTTSGNAEEAASVSVPQEDEPPASTGASKNRVASARKGRHRSGQDSDAQDSSPAAPTPGQDTEPRDAEDHEAQR